LTQSSEMSTRLNRLRVGDGLAPATVIAHNPSTASDNKIHDDDVARQYGFRGGLVPGVIVYAYTTIPLNAALGESWLGNGEATITFVNPAYDGEQLLAQATVAEISEEEAGRRVRFEIRAENRDGVRCSSGNAIAIDAAAAPPPPLTVPDFLDLAPSAVPNPRPELELETAPIGAVLAPLTLPTTIETARAYAQMVGDESPIFSTGSLYGPPLLHPGWLLGNCNTIFVQNYAFGPWIHTRSQIRYLGPALAGRTFTYHGKFIDAYERRGHHYAVLDIFCQDDNGQPVTQVRHTAIFKVGLRV
jgi:acyl dehydratase